MTQPLVGNTVLHYKVIREIGSGGMGVVYEGEDTHLGRRVALKVLPVDLAQDATSLERFQREARAASALNHPGICTVYAIERHDGQPFIVMELLEGRTLAQALAEERFEIVRTLDVAVQIADALESAHAKGIVHRDIKPANIFLNSRGQVKILDFGLAKIETASRDLGTGREASRLHTVAPQGTHITRIGTTMGTVSYMSPEQARGQLTDSRTDLFSLGTVLYQMATGALPFPGETSAVVFEAILNREPPSVQQANASLPQEFARILGKALEKDRSLRYQSATDLKTDLLRLRRDLDSGARGAASLSHSRPGTERAADKSIAVLYFENLGGAKEDEYFRDGITEDIITELSKIKGLKIFSRPTVLAFRDRPVTPVQIGQQLSASFVLGGSLRRAGNRLRINAQLIDTHTDFPLWSERYDREMADVFEVQDEIARKIAEALRITLTPQEEAAIAAKPTQNLQAYDFFLRGKNYARRITRQDMDFALQMFESAVSLDPGFALAHAAIANVSAQYHYHNERTPTWVERANAAARRAIAINPDLPEVQVAQAWILYAQGSHEQALGLVRHAIERRPDCEGAYYLLGRALFAAGRYQEVADIAEAASEAAMEDYNVFVPIMNALVSLGKEDAANRMRQRRILALEAQIRKLPEDARARVLLAADYAAMGRTDDAGREVNLAMALRPNDPMILYNVACVFGNLKEKAETLDALRRSWELGWRDPTWPRRDPDLAIVHGDPEFERLYPDKSAD